MIRPYGLLARIDAVFHKIRHLRHNVKWRANVGKSCSGDIICETCSCIFWCRGLENKEMKQEGTL